MTANFCTECGHHFEHGVAFCPNCGHPVATAPDSQGPPTPPTGPPAAGPVLAPAPTPQSSGGTGPVEASSRRPLLIALGILAVVVIGIGAAIALTRDDDSASGSGEVFLVAADESGPDAFQTAPVAAVETTAPPATTAAPKTTGTAVQVGSRKGGVPGLYGGTKEVGRCDKDQLVSFLASNPAKAGAWVGALNTDPTLRWSGGDSIAEQDIEAYVAELTPVTLASDTRVTNHGYRKGEATRIQAVLQAGTAVLVDQYGVPRVKCACGNPLTSPAPVRSGVRYTGTKWTGWNPAAVTVVVNNTVVINNFVLVNLSGPGYLSRPTGSDGAKDAPAEGPSTPGATTTTAAPGTTATSEAPATTAPAGDFCEVARAWVPGFRNWVLTGYGSDAFPDATEVIAGVDALLPLAPSAAVTSDLQQLRGFLVAPSPDAESIELESLRAALIDGCGIDLDA